MRQRVSRDVIFKFRLDSPLRSQMRRAARRTARTESDIVRQAIAAALMNEPTAPATATENPVTVSTSPATTQS